MSDFFMNTYHRLPVTFVRGSGARLYDASGKEYIDFTAGIAVNSLGHGCPALVKAISEQAERLLHVSNYYQSDTALAFAARLVKACSGMEKVFLANSGAEANEGACKIARKYSLKKYGPGRHRIVTLKGSFHGRTITTLSATGQERFHRDFGPFTEGFAYTEPGQALDRALDPDRVCGFLAEFIQGEGGVIPQSREYMDAAARLCAERDILFIADEVQTGVGRTGTFLACEQWGVKPDIVTLAKGLAGGVPIGAVLGGEKTAAVLETGDHGSTFGGNPLACAAGLVVLDTVDNPPFLAEIRRKGGRIMDGLRTNGAITEVRGLGLMIGADISAEAWPVLERCLASGLLLLSAGPNTLRFLPPYMISDDEIDRGLEILGKQLGTR